MNVPQSEAGKRLWCQQYLEKRQRARTDLFWLANEILSPTESRIMTETTHRLMVDHCQSFYGYRELMDHRSFKMLASELICPMYELPGQRDSLLLASRGHLKTTIQVIAHAIQWIINYPNVRILLVTSTDEKAQIIVGKIKQHFQFNRRFRFLFPEFCPSAKKVSDWGSKTEIVVPNATRRDEPTIMTASVGKALASTHHDVIKATDVVTENNVRTEGMIREVEDFFGYLEPLRERGESKDGTPNPGWLDIEGTIYDFSDYHQKMLDIVRRKPELNWKVTRQSCWLDKDNRACWWPERFPAAELERVLAKIGQYLFSSQYELDPVPPGEGLATREEVVFFPKEKARELMPRYTIQTTVDLGGMDPKNPTADYTVFTTAGFDPSARMDVLMIHRGRFNLDQILELFFLIQKVYPRNIKFKVQKDHFARVLEPIMHREMARREKYLWIEYIPISTSVSKVQRIKGLQGWFKMGLIRFSDAITLGEALVDEILRFPKGAHDDILDTLADHMQDASGDAISDVIPRGKPTDTEVRPGGVPQFDPYRIEIEPEMTKYYAEVTGI